MNKGSFYILSNACMDIFPANTRSTFSNTLTKQFNVNNVGSNSLWLAVDSITIENSIIQYIRTDSEHDIISLKKCNIVNNCDSTLITFSLPKRCFENKHTFLSFFSHECIGKVLYDVKLVNGYINIETDGEYVLISKRFYRFLGFTDTKKLWVLGKDLQDPRISKYYEKYYILDLGGNGRKIFSADQPFDLNIFTPNLLKIISPNITSYECGGGYKNIMSIIPLSHSSSAITFIPAVTKFFKVNSDFLTNISVKIVDENDIPINFTVGPPTITKFQFKEMSNNSNNFYVQTSNNDSTNVFPDNSPSYFKSKLPKAINLQDKWLVALVSIYLPPKIINFSNPMTVIEIIKSNISNVNEIGIPNEKIVLPTKRCATIEELVTLLNSHLSEKGIIFYYIQGKVRIEVETLNDTERYKLKLHNKLACMLGYSQEKLKHENDEHVVITFLSEDKKTFSMYQFDDAPNLEFSIPPWLFLYCNIVSPTNVGHLPVPILKIIPIQNKSIHKLNGVFTEFTNLEYFPTHANTFQTLSFQLRTHDGYFVHFDGNENVQLTLSFQKSI